MQRMRGGQKLNATQIAEILGQKFRIFVGTDWEEFQCKNYDAGKKPANCSDNDLHPEYAQYIAAATLALRELDPGIESPSLEEIFKPSSTKKEEKSINPFEEQNGGQTLTLKDLKDFYENDVLKNLAIYEKYLGLHAEGKELPLDAAKEGDLSKYRFHVKKIGSALIFGGSMRGGNIGDLVFFEIIPTYNPETMGKIWLSDDKFLTSIQIQTSGNLRDLARALYKGQTSPLLEIIIVAKAKDPFTFNRTKYIESLLKQPIEDTIKKIVTADWVDAENKLNEELWRKTSEWARENGNGYFEWTGSKETAPKIVDYCAFITQDAGKCIEFLEQCALKNTTEFPSYCKNLTSSEYFAINIPTGQIAEQVKKINPKVAFGILRKFNFGEYTGHDNEPVRGFTRYKVQSVGSWLKDLQKHEEYFGGKNVVEAIMAKKPLLDYLQILVDWVNANTQALNPEEAHRGKICNQYPKPASEFNLYDHLNPYKAARLRLGELCVGMDRLKSGILTDLAGYSGAKIISNIASVPSGIAMPFNRMPYAYPLPYPGYGMMVGGANDASAELQNIVKLDGYDLMKSFYENLLKSMQCMDGKVNLCKNTRDAIDRKLLSFRDAEQSLRESLDRLIKRKELYVRSHGQIESMKIPEDDLEGVLRKHSNLMNLSAAYNKRAVNLIEVFQSIANALIGKIDDKLKKGDTEEAHRPLTMQYR